MEESLKIVRISHLALISVCAAILFFGLAPNRADLYDSAIKELETLSLLDEIALEDYVYTSAKYDQVNHHHWL